MKSVASALGCAIAALTLSGALAPPAQAQQSSNTIAEIERYRQMLQDGNPAELTSAKGEVLWKTRRGPANASLARCGSVDDDASEHFRSIGEERI